MSKQNDSTIAYKHIYAGGWLSGYLYAKKKRLSGAEVLALHKKAMSDYDDIYETKLMQKKAEPPDEKYKIQVKEYGAKNGRTIEI